MSDIRIESNHPCDVLEVEKSGSDFFFYATEGSQWNSSTILLTESQTRLLVDELQKLLLGEARA